MERNENRQRGRETDREQVIQMERESCRERREREDRYKGGKRQRGVQRKIWKQRGTDAEWERRGRDST